MMMMKPNREKLAAEESLAQLLKMMVDNINVWQEHFVRSQDVYCKNPWTLFNTRDPLKLHNGRNFFVNRTVDSGKTDRCEAGCWRVMGRDKLIKSEKNGKIEILGFMKVYKFCEKEKPKPFFKWIELEKRKERDQRIWVMEEYRLASQWKQDYVICKIRLLYPRLLEDMMCDHLRGYEYYTSHIYDMI